MKKRSSKADSDLSVEIAFLEGLRDSLPGDLELLKVLGDSYTRAGRYKEGLEIDLMLVQQLPKSPVVHYNLACSHSLLGNLRESAASLLRAIECGYHEWAWMEKDPDLENLRGSREFESIKSAIDSLKAGQGRESKAG
jgi:tetratricopeptide (TPR) repeat protein